MAGLWVPRGFQRPAAVLRPYRAHPQASDLEHWWPVVSRDNFAASPFNPRAVCDYIGGAHLTSYDNLSGRLLHNGLVGGFAIYRPTGAGGSFETFTPAYDRFTTAATLNVWVQLNDAIPIGGGENTGLCKVDNCALQTHYPWNDGTAYIGIFRGGSDRVSFAPLASVDRTKPHMLTVTCGTAWRFYQNAILVHETLVNPALQWRGAGDPRLHGNAGYWLAGYSWDWRLYSRALSPAEIRTLYAPETRWALYGGG